MQDDRIRLKTRSRLDRGGAVVSRTRFMALQSERGREAVCRILVIVDNKHAPSGLIRRIACLSYF